MMALRGLNNDSIGTDDDESAKVAGSGHWSDQELTDKVDSTQEEGEKLRRRRKTGSFSNTTNLTFRKILILYD